ncbi:methionine ABC transporter permease [Exiguobacterium sp. Leaf187]|uniref:Methionine ABC transporter permease n=2 Tax=Exiguobacterium TaxID=33986 RepID=A0A0V8GID2_9BACL|nr:MULTISPECIES: methionine ABC transporter permease [Exiguobacterium]AHA30736.1 methionine ABC transporter permease [Exiguobacterium sp. MH3]AOT01702.1 methionine ABC transporter permease [Exiguobacterium sp. U13-1]KNH34682.1 methionine ABC transporter permease [Exiguobacterium acetylicum]KQS19976.1 methionine ABC transporter permease [Exiguobacterium sp. Leaf187]KSU50021.1 methionine ABC transporter permease [Exiguobacterium enclense]
MWLDRIQTMLPELLKALGETAWMVGISLAFALVVGIPLGILLFVTDRGLFFQNLAVRRVLDFVVNIVRSLPFIILLVALIPLTKFLLDNTIGPTAASVSLSVAAIPFLARLVETSLREIPPGLIEAAEACGAKPLRIIVSVLLPEALPGIIQGITLTTISLIGFSAMAGIVGGGGVGDLAIRFGYYRYDNLIMIVTIVVLIVIVQSIQALGNQLARKTDKR